MASNRYNMYDGIDFSDFEPIASYERNAARKIQTAPKGAKRKAAPKLKIVEAPKKTLMQLKREMHASALQTAKIISIAFVLLSLLAALLYGRLKVDELDREIANLNTEITAAQSECVRLNMQIDSVISLKNVEEYAQTNLGMVKMESHQIEYIDLSGEDRVVLSGEKMLSKNSESFVSKVMEYISK